MSQLRTLRWKSGTRRQCLLVTLYLKPSAQGLSLFVILAEWFVFTGHTLKASACYYKTSRSQRKLMCLHARVRISQMTIFFGENPPRLPAYAQRSVLTGLARVLCTCASVPNRTVCHCATYNIRPPFCRLAPLVNAQFFRARPPLSLDARPTCAPHAVTSDKTRLQLL